MLFEIGIKIPIIHSTPRPIWNFGKAQWDKFAAQSNTTVKWIPLKSCNYNRFIKAIKTTTKPCTPCLYRKEYGMMKYNREFEITTGTVIAYELLIYLDIEQLRN